jgi:pilus assembly protein Flp/PilA
MLTFLKAWFVTRVGQYLPKDEKGQDGAEYGLLVALIAIIIVVGVGLFGTALNDFFTGLASTVTAW